MGAVYERSCLLVHYDRVYATVHYFTIDEREAGLVLFWGVREPKSSHKKIIVEVPWGGYGKSAGARMAVGDFNDIIMPAEQEEGTFWQINQSGFLLETYS